MKVKIPSLNYSGHIIESGKVFQTVRLLTGTLVLVPRHLLQVLE